MTGIPLKSIKQRQRQQLGRYIYCKRNIYDFDFADENTGYIAGNPGIQRKTTDGGVTWQEIPNLPYMYTSIIRFADVNTGYAISDYGYIYKTTDGGNSWINEGIYRIRDAAYKNGNIYLAGIGGMILKTYWSTYNSSARNNQ
jgi:photosystem II stability/assembly factor-like uncharacterized protein